MGYLQPSPEGMRARRLDLIKPVSFPYDCLMDAVHRLYGGGWGGSVGRGGGAGGSCPMDREG
jgi:hypothetical protein